MFGDRDQVGRAMRRGELFRRDELGVVQLTADDAAQLIGVLVALSAG